MTNAFERDTLLIEVNVHEYITFIWEVADATLCLWPVVPAAKLN